MEDVSYRKVLQLQGSLSRDKVDYFFRPSKLPTLEDLKKSQNLRLKTINNPSAEFPLQIVKVIKTSDAILPYSSCTICMMRCLFQNQSSFSQRLSEFQKLLQSLQRVCLHVICCKILSRLILESNSHTKEYGQMRCADYHHNTYICCSCNCCGFAGHRIIFLRMNAWSGRYKETCKLFQQQTLHGLLR